MCLHSLSVRLTTTADVMASGHDPAALEWSYELVPSSPLPVLDLSRSLKSRYLPECLLPWIDGFLARYNRPLFVCYALSLVLSISVPLLDAQTGCYAAFLSALLGLPLGLGSLGTLRYDVVRLLVRTYDFWFFLCVNGTTNFIVAALFSDLRMTRLIIDWSGFQNIVLIDAQLRGIRQLSTLAIVGTFTVFMLLTCVMLGRVDQLKSISFFQYANQYSSYKISANDIVGNGLGTMMILLMKIVYRKRQAFRRRVKSSVIECATYRCCVKLSPCSERQLTAADPGSSSDTTLRRGGTRRPSFLQQMRYVKYHHAIDSRRIVLPIQIKSKARFPSAVLILLYTMGVGGLLLSFIALSSVSAQSGQDDSQSYADQLPTSGCAAFVLTAAFTTTFAGFYQWELLVSVATSFDFVFYALQLTLIHVSLCILYEWELARCLGVAASWVWIHWALTLDALTPMMKTKLGFHIRFAIPVVAMFILWHVALLFHILGDSGPKDRIVWEGQIWSRHLQVRVVPFYFSRLVTLTLWCTRMVNRLARSTNEDTTILRGAVTYDNYLVLGERRKSRAGPSRSRIGTRKNRVAPAGTTTAPVT